MLIGPLLRERPVYAGIGILVAVALALAVAPVGARADSRDTWVGPTIAAVYGTPLEAGIGDYGSLHAQLDGVASPLDVFWFDKAGLTLTVVEGGSSHPYGIEALDGDQLQPVSMPAASGSGTATDPWRITSTWNAGSPALFRVTETMTFIDGSPRFTIAYSVENVTSAPLTFRAYVSAEVSGGFAVPLARRDATVPGSVGLYVPLDGGARDPNDPVFDGHDFGRSIDFEPDPSAPYVRSVAGDDGQSTSNARLAIENGDPLPATLPARAPTLPFIAAEWDAHAPTHAPLDPGQSFAFATQVKLATALRTPPILTSADPTRPYTLKIHTDLGDHGPLADTRLGWIVEGMSYRSLSGWMTTDSAGNASLTWTADDEMHDRAIVWVDTDGDGTWDRESETARQAEVDWGQPGQDVPGSGTTGGDVTASGGGLTAIGPGFPGSPGFTAAPNPPRPRLRLLRAVAKRVGRHAVLVSGLLSAHAAAPLALRLTTRSGRLLARGRTHARGRRFRVRMHFVRRLSGRRALLVMHKRADALSAALTVRRPVVVRRQDAAATKGARR